MGLTTLLTGHYMSYIITKNNKLGPTLRTRVAYVCLYDLHDYSFSNHWLILKVVYLILDHNEQARHKSEFIPSYLHSCLKASFSAASRHDLISSSNSLGRVTYSCVVMFDIIKLLTPSHIVLIVNPCLLPFYHNKTPRPPV